MRVAGWLLVALLLLLGSGCAVDDRPDAATTAEAFVLALGTWDEPTIRAMVVDSFETAVLIDTEGNQWRGWTRELLGPQAAVMVTDMQVVGDLATVVVESQHAQGAAQVTLTLQREDREWKVQTWRSIRR